MPAVLVARFAKRSELAPIVRAALDEEIVYVPLPQAPPAGRNVLQLLVSDELVGAVSAELVGSGRDGAYPLRMKLLDRAHASELESLLEQLSGSSAARPPSQAPAPARGVFVDEERTLASRAAPPPRTPAPPPPHPPAPPAPPAASLRDSSDDLTLERARGTSGVSSSPPPSPSPRRRPFFTDEESQTLPGSSRAPGATTEVSWNVRIAPTTKDVLCGRTIAGGKYVLDSVIGTGAIGIVFKASHRELGRTVAIKVLHPRYRDDPDLLAVFRSEARAASQLEHPNVARVYDFGQEGDGLVYIVMEYLSGYTLGNVLDARHKLTSVRAIDVMVQVCAGLSAAHDREIVHRDVKPDNIVLVPTQDDEGRPVETVKVCDFGIAALGTTQTESGVAAGTPQYMAPEQTTGSPVAPSADVYACGVVLYEMLTGEVPFTSDQAFRILMKHRSEAPRPPRALEPAIPEALEAVILRCMAKSPAHRFQSARELRVALRYAGGQ